LGRPVFGWNVPDEVLTHRAEHCSGLFPGESGKVRKYRGHEVAVMRVVWRETGRIEIEEVTRLGHRLRPRGSRHGKELAFDDALLVAQKLRIGLDLGDHTANIGFAFCAAMPRCLSSSIGVSVTRRARVDALRVGQIYRTDRDHFHRRALRRRTWHYDHGGDTPKAWKRKPLDHLLIGDDFVGSRRKLAIDTLDPERMPEMNHFASRAGGHVPSPANLRTNTSSFSDIVAPSALWLQLAIVFSRGAPHLIE